MQNSYTVINASAGSGKTYALVQRLLMICLRYPYQHQSIRNILALTFTNKAANEMKERILTWLGNFSSERFADNTDLKNIQRAFEEEGLKITLDELHVRSKKLLDYVLHNYSTLNIGTIDRFNSRLVRSFSYELGLAKNFNLEIEAEPFLIEAVDKMLDQIGENEAISNSFMDYVDYSLENNERINLNKSLYDSAKEFVKDIHYEHLKSNQSFDDTSYEDIKNRIRNEIVLNRKQAADLAAQSIELFRSRDIDIEDFAQGKNGLGGFFVKVLDFYQQKRPGFPFPTTQEDSVVNNYRKGASSKSKNKEADILDILDQLLENRMKLILLYIETQKKEKILSALLPLKVNKDIQDELKKIEEENDLVLLSKFNILINENLRNEPSAFIYEKVGSQFQHYFFDEFQDTSELQWQNFIPLRDHSIATENTSFTLVGDPKQSIYRFRGGESKLMLDIINKKENSPREADLMVLKDNWRSAKNIVKFNNELYRFHSEILEEEHRNIFGTDAEQNPKSSFDGRVKVNLIENLTNEDFYNDTSERMRKDIQECLDNGFRFSDITVLCRGNFDIFSYSQKLGGLKVKYRGQETIIKTISEKGLTLELSNTLKAVIEFLKWESNPKNRPNLIMMMYHLNSLGRIRMPDFTLEMKKILSIESHEEVVAFLELHYGIKLKQDILPRFNLYNYVEFYINEFSFEDREKDFLLNFLEMLFNFTQNAGASIKEFLKYWDEEASQYTIQASENIDAIQIMTIHKAKGLEFPVVFIPMMNKNRDGEFSNWFETGTHESLKSVNINQFSKTLEVYDEEIQQFNRQNSYKNFIDRLCLQYVATTRPVEQLFFYIQKANKTSNHLELLDFLQSKNKDGADEFDLYETSPQILKKYSADKTSEFRTRDIPNLKNISEKNTSIKIATPSKTYQARNEKVKIGLFAHELLAKINTVNDIEQVLERYLLDGQITLNERDTIRQRLHDIIGTHAEFFDSQWEVINEKEIMVSENGESRIYRPDRILKGPKGYIIVDFKTGEPSEKDKRQIENYKRVLERLGRKVIDTRLVYL
ncbi:MULTISPECIES: UvrD-helicase domain-containing protein [Chryseobacterium]|uniref:DNA 3'-5' helicase n=1 Tax=Chryseobacterium camelliae TaxID=1265445 RepID=A0ABU0TNW7_9FLAO|nr:MULTISPECIES: UvrD-helicase domain-containing protein [Chryseobacterium]MDT3407458.1 ATP-dependent exoDNAse (exonuclease V) beta subunit [Pseudacidovorax intermedius]MDQ1098691.1 ATP-dependent exoDNAse (exonuclease V) beta subunit [Chryseobacterium camelliae]MDQ1102618.1 ATP-dependent exoDNAse (exonuclease V) beta subunit [Chryseobacterium sp. SORGH_AS_1048]MDR6086047.1 ATP-dependent exoDNAse (exonuclease V) beta subunit [Chryseobacterium sp. SORGH_AS_0909]MDR6130415.1 ATP-dependent exoDNAs